MIIIFISWYNILIHIDKTREMHEKKVRGYNWIGIKVRDCCSLVRCNGRGGKHSSDGVDQALLEMREIMRWMVLYCDGLLLVFFSRWYVVIFLVRISLVRVPIIIPRMTMMEVVVISPFWGLRSVVWGRFLLRDGWKSGAGWSWCPNWG